MVQNHWFHYRPISNHPVDADIDCDDADVSVRFTVAGDFDGDGQDEIAAAIDKGGTEGNDFWVMEFDGTQEQWKHMSPISGHPYRADLDCRAQGPEAKFAVAADFDGDGQDELAVAIDKQGSGGNDFWVMEYEKPTEPNGENESDGTWQHLSPIPGHPLDADVDCSNADVPAKFAVAGDFDGDEKEELAVGIDESGSAGNDLWVMEYDPNNEEWEHFSLISNHPMDADLDCSADGPPVMFAVTGDFDKDGRDELAAAIDKGDSGGNDLWVMDYSSGDWGHMNGIDGHPLGADVDCSDTTVPAKFAVAGDFDNDGKEELAVAAAWSPDVGGSTGNDFWVMEYEPDNKEWEHFSLISDHAIDADLDCSADGPPVMFAVTGDFDGDGRDELAAAINVAGSGGNDFWVMDYSDGQWAHLSPIDNHPLDADLDCSTSDIPVAQPVAGQFSPPDSPESNYEELAVPLDQQGSEGNDFWVMAFSESNCEQIGDILIVSSRWVHGDGYKSRLKDFLHSNTSQCPDVGEGTHDFWACYPKPSIGDNPDYSHQNMSATPRPFRGLINMAWIPNSMDKGLGTLLHEVGHHWLVPDDIEIDGKTLLPMKDFRRQLNKEELRDVRFDRPPMIGRDSAHWSPYWQSDGSVMDGLNYDRTEDQMGQETLWQETDQPGYNIERDEGRDLEVSASYSDLDLYLMGVKSSDECYPDEQGQFYWMEPRVFGELSYQAGMFLLFNNGDLLQFGFGGEYDKIKVLKNGSDVFTQNIQSSYKPFEMDRSGMVFRIRRDGYEYDFQARIDNTDSSGANFDLFGDQDSAATSGGFDQWRQVYSIDEENYYQPVAVGVMVQRKGRFTTDIAFQPLEVQYWDNRETPNLDPEPKSEEKPWSPWRDNYTEDVTTYLHFPAQGVKHWEDQHGFWHLHTPYTYDSDGESVGVDGYFFNGESEEKKDQTPKAFIPLPFAHQESDNGSSPESDLPGEGDDSPLQPDDKIPIDSWTVATKAKIHQAVMVPWAWGSASGKYLIGRENAEYVSRVSLDGLSESEKQKRDAPPQDEYKIAHIILAPEREMVTQDDIDMVSDTRKYFDVLFEKATDGNRKMDSIL